MNGADQGAHRPTYLFRMTAGESVIRWCQTYGKAWIRQDISMAWRNARKREACLLNF